MRKIPRVPEEVRVNLGLPLLPLTRKQIILLIVFNIIVLIVTYILYINSKPSEQPKIEIKGQQATGRPHLYSEL